MKKSEKMEKMEKKFTKTKQNKTKNQHKKPQQRFYKQHSTKFCARTTKDRRHLLYRHTPEYFISTAVLLPGARNFQTIYSYHTKLERGGTHSCVRIYRKNVFMHII